MRRAAPAIEALVALAVTLPVAIVLGYPALWFWVPFVILTVTGRPYDVYGLTLRNPGSLRFHLITAGVIFGGYALLHYAVARVALGLRFTPSLPPDLAEVIVTQLVVVGLCEEFFFRGYLQTQLNRCFDRPYQFLGVRFGAGLIVAAVLFALCHIVRGDLTQLRVVFFGLFAGWLRERTDTIAVPAVYHGVANILYQVMQRSLV